MINLSEQEIISVKLISGVGPLHSTIIFVGEAPGKQEDLLGEPFVGRSGLLLNKWINLLGLIRSDVYITNVVKVRPHNNRTPTDEEIKSWLTLLHNEITSISPKYIVALGKVAEKALQLMGYDDIIVLYHPSYILRNPQMEHIVLYRLERLKLKLKEINND